MIYGSFHIPTIGYNDDIYECDIQMIYVNGLYYNGILQWHDLMTYESMWYTNVINKFIFYEWYMPMTYLN